MASKPIEDKATPSPIRIAIQGELGSNSHLAALNFADSSELATLSWQILPCITSIDVFEALAVGSADCAVLPIENTLYGSVFEHYDLLLEYSAGIIGERLLRVRHNLIAQPGVDLASVRRVLSHPVALSQCRRWLRAHPQIVAVPSYDTAGSVKQIMEAGWKDAAALAPALAAQQHGAEVLLPGVEDSSENFTRFYVLKQQDNVSRLEDANKVSLAFRLEHRPGALLGVLQIFAGADLNLTRIESRPVPGRPWEYVFFLDLRFEVGEAAVEALRQLQAQCHELRILGYYRAALDGSSVDAVL